MRILTAAFGLALVGCAPQPVLPSQSRAEPQTRFIRTYAPFDPDEVAWFNTDGEGRIEGSALLRTVGGDVRTCAGLEVTLLPAGEYASERMGGIYQDNFKGFVPVSVAAIPLEFSDDDPRYTQTTKTTLCDAQGEFEFDNLPMGDYFVTTSVIWQVPGRYGSSSQGGVIMQRVNLPLGETVRVVLTQ